MEFFNFTTCMAFAGVFLALLGIIAANAALFIPLFLSIRSDMKAFESKVDSWKEEIHKEMQDFHGRLCAIEEKNRRR